MDDRDQTPSDRSADLEQEVRRGRKFTATEAVARLAGPGAMKGASPVSRVKQAEIEIESWLQGHFDDAAGAFRTVLQRRIRGSPLLLDNLDRPLAALGDYCRDVCASDYLLEELVREADVEWGRAMDERPYFEKGGSAPDPNDPYTVESVRAALRGALAQLPDTTR